jgi:hypothetical protein
MPWTDPPDFEPDTELAAADLDILSADLLFLKGITDGVSFSGTQLGRSGTQNITTGTWTAVTWQTEAFDYGGWWASGTDIIVPAGAIPDGYTSIALLITFRSSFAVNGTNTRFLRLLNNGSQFGKVSTRAIDGENTDLVMVEFVVVEAGDVITAEVHQNSGSTITIGADNTQITVVRYAPAA